MTNHRKGESIKPTILVACSQCPEHHPWVAYPSPVPGLVILEVPLSQPCTPDYVDNIHAGKWGITHAPSGASLNVYCGHAEQSAYLASLLADLCDWTADADTIRSGNPGLSSKVRELVGDYLIVAHVPCVWASLPTVNA